MNTINKQIQNLNKYIKKKSFLIIILCFKPEKQNDICDTIVTGRKK